MEQRQKSWLHKSHRTNLPVRQCSAPSSRSCVSVAVVCRESHHVGLGPRQLWLPEPEVLVQRRLNSKMRSAACFPAYRPHLVAQRRQPAINFHARCPRRNTRKSWPMCSTVWAKSLPHCRVCTRPQTEVLAVMPKLSFLQLPKPQALALLHGAGVSAPGPLSGPQHHNLEIGRAPPACET